MDRHTEQSLREEVIYLHSLWHQGPPSNPRANPNYRNPNPNQRIDRNSNPNRRNAQQSNRSQLKPVDKKIKKKEKGSVKKLPPPSDLVKASKAAATVQSASSGQPISIPAKTNSVNLPNAQEQPLLHGTGIPDEAIIATKKFFNEIENSGGGIDSEDDNDDWDTIDKDGNAQYNFFKNLFEENSELRDYYEKNKKNGEFCCLVCVLIWKNARKRFKNCFSLLQHSVTVPKAKKRKAHRAYAKVLCKSLGWDMNRVPAMHKPSNKQTDKSKGKEEANKDSAMDNVDTTGSNVNQDKELPSSSVPEASSADNAMHHESSLKADDVDKCDENIENGVSSTSGNLSGEDDDVGEEK